MTHPIARVTPIFMSVLQGAPLPPWGGKILCVGDPPGGFRSGSVSVAAVGCLCWRVDDFGVFRLTPIRLWCREPVCQFGGGGHSCCPREPWIVAGEHARQSPVFLPPSPEHVPVRYVLVVAVAGRR